MRVWAVIAFAFGPALACGCNGGSATPPAPASAKPSGRTQPEPDDVAVARWKALAYCKIPLDGAYLDPACSEATSASYSETRRVWAIRAAGVLAGEVHRQGDVRCMLLAIFTDRSSSEAIRCAAIEALRATTDSREPLVPLANQVDELRSMIRGAAGRRVQECLVKGLPTFNGGATGLSQDLLWLIEDSSTSVVLRRAAGSALGVAMSPSSDLINDVAIRAARASGGIQQAYIGALEDLIRRTSDRDSVDWSRLRALREEVGSMHFRDVLDPELRARGLLDDR